MSETLESMRRKIDSAAELESVVRTMRALAAASIVQYERAVQSLDEYYRTVELGLVAWLRHTGGAIQAPAAVARIGAAGRRAATGAVVFGSDQGLVGRFNEMLSEFTARELNGMPGVKRVFAVGERVQGFLEDAALPATASFDVPNSIAAITLLVGHILSELERQQAQGLVAQVYVFHNRPRSRTVYEPVMQRLLPLDETWRRGLATLAWPSENLPEPLNASGMVLQALIREYLFISLFRACAESLASENASRLAAMRRAEKKIGEMLEDLGHEFHRLRQSRIDEELFDVISGFEALATVRRRRVE